MQEPQGYYAASAPPAPARPRLSDAVKADVCVIGGGFTGLSAALHLAEAGAKVALVEAQSVGFAASGRNGGQLCTGLRKSQQVLEKELGKQHARDLWDLNEEAKALIGNLSRKHDIACDLKPGLVNGAHDKAALRELEEGTEYLNTHYNYSAARMMDADETARLVGTTAYKGARYDSGAGHIHPLKYARGLAAAAGTAGAVIYERSPARALEQQRDTVIVRCESGNVEAGHVLMATDAFSAEIAPELAPYIGHVESFITATAPLPPQLANTIISCDAAVSDTRHVLDYYRKSADGRLLFAGRESYWSIPEDVAAIVRPRMLTVFPQLQEVATDYAWSGDVGITRTRMPHFGRLGPRVLFAHGYSGQGVALSGFGGKLMAEAILGKPERFEVFARVPAKKFPGGALLRKPMIAAALLAFKIADAI
ncbi:MAG: FAD-binding oxidoreductase [Rhizomicrobium sp.]